MEQDMKRLTLGSVLELLGDGGFLPHCGCGPHVIHGVEVSALSAPRCRHPLHFRSTPPSRPI